MKYDLDALYLLILYSGCTNLLTLVSGQAYFFEDYGAVICYNAFRCSFTCIPEGSAVCAEEQQQAGYEDKVRRGSRYFSCL